MFVFGRGRTVLGMVALMLLITSTTGFMVGYGTSGPLVTYDADSQSQRIAENIREDQVEYNNPAVPDSLEEPVERFHILPEPYHSQSQELAKDFAVAVTVPVTKAAFTAANIGMRAGYASQGTVPTWIVSYGVQGINFVAVGGLILWQVNRVRSIVDSSAA